MHDLSIYSEQINSIKLFAKRINFDSVNGDYNQLLINWIEDGRKFQVNIETNKSEVLRIMKQLTA